MTAAIAVIDFCCGRTQRDRCRKCGRDFNAAAPLKPEQLAPMPAPAFLELKAFRTGMLIGFALGLAVAGLIVTCARL